jgi:hypothetical protein
MFYMVFFGDLQDTTRLFREIMQSTVYPVISARRVNLPIMQVRSTANQKAYFRFLVFSDDGALQEQ